jgi:acetoin utilization deacetylase AcuC-like enzyme
MRLFGLYNDLFLAHHEWRHPERPERLQSIRRVLETSGMMVEMEWPAISPAQPEQVFAVHDEALWRQVQRLSASGGGRIDADTFVNASSFDAACHAAGAAVAAAEAVIREESLAVALVRPPGHHATPRRAMGFCLFNNVAIAAQHAIDALGLDRVLILDWDVHHGNGTQDIFYESPQVFFSSIHQFPFYPGTGHWKQVGHGEGVGTTLNIPLSPGHGDESYLAIFDNLIVPAIERFEPQLILLSAGFDAHWSDPLAGMHLTVTGYHGMAARLRAAADAAGAPVAVVLEGGYDLDAIAHSLYATLLGLLKRPLLDDPLGEGPPVEELNPALLIQHIRDEHPVWQERPRRGINDWWL